MTESDILIVEDDPDVRDAMSEVLQDEGYETTVAAQGKEALDRLSGGYRPALILLDMMMPVMDGEEFLDQIRGQERLREIPVLVVSATSVHPPGAQAFLQKPFELTSLLQAIERWCGPASHPAQPHDVGLCQA